MTKNLSHIASKTIAPIDNFFVFKKMGKVKDIIEEIFNHDFDAYKDVINFAPHLKGKNNLETAENIWNFLKKEIKYKEDPVNNQFIQYPRRLYKNKLGDCKSLSIFTAAILKALKIPYQYRFTNYYPTSLKHVYVTIPKTKDEKEIIIDAVWNKFNSEKPYYQKIDIMPDTAIYSLGTIKDSNLERLTKAQFFIQIGKDRLKTQIEVERQKGKIYNRVGYQKQLDFLNEVEKIINSKKTVTEKVTALKRFSKNKNLSFLIDRIIAGLNSPLVSYYDNLNDDSKETFRKVFYELIPQSATHYIDIFAAPRDIQKYLNPIGYKERENKLQSLNSLAKLLDIDLDVLLYSLKTAIIKQTGLTPEVLFRSLNYNEKESIGVAPLVLPASVVAAQKAIPLIKAALPVVKKVGSFLKGLFGGEKQINEGGLYPRQVWDEWFDVLISQGKKEGEAFKKIPEVTRYQLSTELWKKLVAAGRANEFNPNPDTIYQKLLDRLALDEYNANIKNIENATPLTFSKILELNKNGQISDSDLNQIRAYYNHSITQEDEYKLLVSLGKNGFAIPARGLNPRTLEELINQEKANSLSSGKTKNWC